MKRTYILKNTRTGEEIPEFHTVVNVTLTDKELIFEFDCKNSQCFSAGNKYNDPIFDGDVCEAFICTDGNRNHYYEIEIAPNGTQFLKKVVNLGSPDDYELEAVEESFLDVKTEICGNDYKVRFSMPLDKIGYDPKIGILYNIYRIETEGGETDKHLLAMNPTLKSRFHCPEAFVELK